MRTRVNWKTWFKCVNTCRWQTKLTDLSWTKNVVNTTIIWNVLTTILARCCMSRRRQLMNHSKAIWLTDQMLCLTHIKNQSELRLNIVGVLLISSAYKIPLSKPNNSWTLSCRKISWRLSFQNRIFSASGQRRSSSYTTARKKSKK